MSTVPHWAVQRAADGHAAPGDEVKASSAASRKSELESIIASGDAMALGASIVKQLGSLREAAEQ